MNCTTPINHENPPGKIPCFVLRKIKVKTGIQSCENSENEYSELWQQSKDRVRNGIANVNLAPNASYSFEIIGGRESWSTKVVPWWLSLLTSEIWICWYTPQIRSAVISWGTECLSSNVFAVVDHGGDSLTRDFFAAHGVESVSLIVVINSQIRENDTWGWSGQVESVRQYQQEATSRVHCYL